MEEHNLNPCNAEETNNILNSSWFCCDSLLESFFLEHEHYTDDWDLYSYRYTVNIVPVTGLLRPDDGLHIPLPVYHYCPDHRENTFKLLGKVSPGLPPPFLS